MKPEPKPTIVSLEQHRRQREAAERKKKEASVAAAKARRTSQKAINWDRAPKFLAVVVLFFAAMWLIRQLGALVSPFH